MRFLDANSVGADKWRLSAALSLLGGDQNDAPAGPSALQYTGASVFRQSCQTECHTTGTHSQSGGFRILCFVAVFNGMLYFMSAFQHDWSAREYSRIWKSPCLTDGMGAGADWEKVRELTDVERELAPFAGMPLYSSGHIPLSRPSCMTSGVLGT